MSTISSFPIIELINAFLAPLEEGLIFHWSTDHLRELQEITCYFGKSNDLKHNEKKLCRGATKVAGRTCSMDNRDGSIERLAHILSFARAIMLPLMDQPYFNRNKDLVEQFEKSYLLSPFVKMFHSPLDPTELVKLFKYITIVPLARLRVVPHGDIMRQNDPPEPLGFESPVPWYLWNGRLGKMIKNLVGGRCSKKALDFAWNWQNSKKATREVGGDFIQGCLKKHRVAMSTPADLEWDLFRSQVPEPANQTSRGDELVYGAESFLDWVEDACEHFLPALIKPNPDCYTVNQDHFYEASTGASLEYKRSDGGQREYIRDRLIDGIKFEWEFYLAFGEKIERATFRPYRYLYSMVEIRPGVIREIRNDYDMAPRDIMREIWQTCKEDYQNSDSDLLSAKVSTVLEPLKVRTLTKGPSLPYYLAKNVQKDLWSSLRNCNVFRLIGEPVTEEIIEDLQQKSEGDFWVSGDYSSATDLLNFEVSKVILKKCLNLLGYIDESEEFKILMAVLKPHRILYPVSRSRGGPPTPVLPPVIQRNGQLMGSPLSFPILCIANFLAWAYAHYEGSFDRRIRRKVFDQLPVLINGDDSMFKSTHMKYDVWKRITKTFGLELSPGKNLLSSSFGTINTTMFRFTKDKVKLQRYANIGLLVGNTKTFRSAERARPFWDIHNMIKPGFHNEKLFTKLFLYYWRDQIRDATANGRFNLYLPRILGGCGLDGEPKAYTEGQLALATQLYRKYTTLNNDEIPDLVGLVTHNFTKEVVKIRYRGPWKMVPSPQEIPEDYEEVVEKEHSAPPLSCESTSEPVVRRYPLPVTGKRIYGVMDVVDLKTLTDSSVRVRPKFMR